MNKYLKEKWTVLISEDLTSDTILDNFIHIVYIDCIYELNIELHDKEFRFTDVISFKSSLRSSRQVEFNRYTDNIDPLAIFVRVENSNYIKWLEDSGYKQINGSAFNVRHYMILSKTYVVDILVYAHSLIVIDNKVLAQ